MILHPNGSVEGTPEEIAQWKQMQEKKVEEELRKKYTTGGNGFINVAREVVSSNRKCPNEGHPCYCTGACN